MTNTIPDDALTANIRKAHAHLARFRSDPSPI